MEICYTISFVKQRLIQFATAKYSFILERIKILHFWPWETYFCGSLPNNLENSVYLLVRIFLYGHNFYVPLGNGCFNGDTVYTHCWHWSVFFPFTCLHMQWEKHKISNEQFWKSKQWWCGIQVEKRIAFNISFQSRRYADLYRILAWLLDCILLHCLFFYLRMNSKEFYLYKFSVKIHFSIFNSVN